MVNVEEVLRHAGMLNATGNGRAALNVLREALSEHPRDPDLLAALGVVSDAIGQPNQALGYLRQALQVVPTDLHVWTNLAFITGREDPPAGVEAYRELLQHHPDDLPALANLGALLLDLGRHDEARDVLERALAIDPAVPVLRYNLGRVHDALGNRTIARSHHEEAARLAPDWDLPRRALAAG